MIAKKKKINKHLTPFYRMMEKHNKVSRRRKANKVAASKRKINRQRSK